MVTAVKFWLTMHQKSWIKGKIITNELPFYSKKVIAVTLTLYTNSIQARPYLNFQYSMLYELYKNFGTLPFLYYYLCKTQRMKYAGMRFLQNWLDKTFLNWNQEIIGHNLLCEGELHPNSFILNRIIGSTLSPLRQHQNLCSQSH